MKRVNLADAKAHLSELATRASNGEVIEIMRRGKLVARLLPPENHKLERFDWEEHERIINQMTPQTESAGDFMRRLRDSGF